MAESQPLIEVRHITFGYGREVVLDEVDLAVSRGDFLAVIGPNGGGKTTLLKVILGLLRPWSGEVIRHLGARKGQLGYVPQFSTFDRNFPMQVSDMVLMGKLGERGFFKPYRREDREAVARVIERLRLTAVARKPVSEISGGQLQRVLIARALVGSPEVLFLDEPTASIDAESRETLQELLRELHAEIPIVVVTHDVTSIAPLVTRVACINRRLFYHGAELSRETMEEVYGCPVELVAHGVPHRVLESH
jgi:zinc transport system ATP-binding protein